MSDNSKLSELVEVALAKAESYQHSTVLSYRNLAGVVNLETRSSGSSDSILSILGSMKIKRTYEDGNKVESPLVQLSNRSLRRNPDDVIKLDLDSQANNTSVYRLLANAGYGSISDGIAVRKNSWLAGWIESMFSTPLNYKAYIAHLLNAACYANRSKEEWKIYVTDLSKVKVLIPSADDKSKLIEVPAGAFGGQDGSGIISGPLAKTMQFRLASLNGVSFTDGVETLKTDMNAFAKGALMKGFISKVTSSSLVFDKQNVTKENIIILDVGNFKGNVAESFIKDKCKEKLSNGTVLRMNFLNGDCNHNKLFAEVTLINDAQKTSASYQWASVLMLPELDNLTNLYPKGLYDAELTPTQKEILDKLNKMAGSELDGNVLSGNQNRNQLLTYLLAYLPKVKTRKCLMVKSGGVVDGYKTLFEGEVVDVRDSSEFVAGRNPMLTPAGILVLANKRGTWLEEIYNLDEGVYTIFTSEDCSKMQADDDGDDNGVDDNPILLKVAKAHQKWVGKSLFRFGVSIEQDKAARVTENPMDIERICSILSVEKSEGQSKKEEAISYSRNSIAGVEAAAVGLCSDIAVNVLSQVQWVRWDGEENSVSKKARALMGKDIFKALFDAQPADSKWCWIPKNILHLRLLLLYFLTVWLTQTSIDWKKRAYVVLCLNNMLDVYSYKKDKASFELIREIDSVSFEYLVKTEIDPDTKEEKKIYATHEYSYEWFVETQDTDSLMVKTLDKHLNDVLNEDFRFKDPSHVFLFEIIGGWIASKKPMILTRIDDLVVVKRQPDQELFWPINAVQTVLNKATALCNAESDRSWKSVAKNGFYTPFGYSSLGQVTTLYTKLQTSVWGCNGIGKLLTRALNKNHLSDLHSAYGSFHRLSESHKAWLRDQPEEIHEWYDHLKKALRTTKSQTSVKSAWEEKVSLKAFQNFLRSNDLPFDENLVMVLAAIDADDDSILRGSEPLIQTIFEYAKLIDTPLDSMKIATENAIMNCLDRLAFATMQKLQPKIVKAKKISFSAFFKEGWTNGNNIVFNDTFKDVKVFVKTFKEIFMADLSKAVEEDKALNTIKDKVEKETDEFKELFKSVVVSNIARTVRTLDYWGCATSWSSLRTNSANWYDANSNLGMVSYGDYFERFKSSTSPWQLVEKLILEKGWVPNDISLQLALIRPHLLRGLSWNYYSQREEKTITGSYLIQKITSYTFCGDSEERDFHSFILGVCGKFS